MLLPFQPPPDFLRQLLIGEDSRSRAFRKSLQKYNSALTFTYVNCKPDRRLPRNRRSPICYQFHGELYHLQGSYNRLHVDSCELLYQDFPNSYVWEPKKKCWQPRQRGFAVGRIYACSPMAGEKYYLRMLLTVVPGPQSFEDLRPVDGVIYPTFQAACSARRLLEDDQEWFSSFAEVVRFSSGHALRALFGTALIHGRVTDPTALWNRYANDICDDLPHRLRSMIDIPDDLTSPHLDYGLYLLNEVLSDLGK